MNKFTLRFNDGEEREGAGASADAVKRQLTAARKAEVGVCEPNDPRITCAWIKPSDEVRPAEGEER